MDEIRELEERASLALERVKNALRVFDENQTLAVSTPVESTVSDLQVRLDNAEASLEKEKRKYENLIVSYLDISNDFGTMELQSLKDQKNIKAETEVEKTTKLTTKTVSAERDELIKQLARLRSQREDDIKEVDVILSKLAPIIEGKSWLKKG